ncbi:hypothetical protein CMK18_20325 [Candidatus Poribacteria bacterium]|nr:hypothetical protein [Candidatus Poribacteria bacterium]
MYPRIIDFGVFELFGRSIPVAINSYGVMIGLGFLAVLYGLNRELPRKGHGELLATAIIYAAFFGGLFGAKIYFWIEFGRFDFFSGFVFYGGLIGGSAAVLIITTIISSVRSIWSVIDSVGCLLLIGYGIGRIGCFLAGDGCYGIPGDTPWCVTFLDPLVTNFVYQGKIYYVTSNLPTGLPEGAILTAVHPTPIYETIISCISFCFLWSIRLKVEQKSGVLFGLSILAMGIERFTIEFWRINEKYFWAQFSGAQAISLALMTIGVLIVIYRWSRSSQLTSDQ